MDLCINDSSQLLYSGFSILLSFVLLSIYTRSICVHYKLNGVFHPFFTCFLFLLLITSICVQVVTIIRHLFEICEFSTENIDIIDVILVGYSLGMLSSIVMERIISTLYRSSYEFSRKWLCASLSQPLAGSFIFFQITLIAAVMIGPSSYRFHAFLVLHIIFILCLLIIFYVNHSMAIKLVGSGVPLSTRYQVTENIRTLRMILPFVCMDVAVACVNVGFKYLMNYFFTTDPTTTCILKSQFIFFILKRLIIFILNTIGWISLCLSHPAYRKNFVPCLFKKREVQYNKASISIGPREKNIPKIFNVLGIEIADSTEQKYFENLSKMWNRL